MLKHLVEVLEIKIKVLEHSAKAAPAWRGSITNPLEVDKLENTLKENGEKLALWVCIVDKLKTNSDELMLNINDINLARVVNEQQLEDLLTSEAYLKHMRQEANLEDGSSISGLKEQRYHYHTDRKWHGWFVRRIPRFDSVNAQAMSRSIARSSRNS